MLIIMFVEAGALKLYCFAVYVFVVNEFIDLYVCFIGINVYMCFYISFLLQCFLCYTYFYLSYLFGLLKQPFERQY